MNPSSIGGLQMLSNTAVEVNNDKDTPKNKTKKDKSAVPGRRSHLTMLGRCLNFKLEKSIVSIKYSTI